MNHQDFWNDNELAQKVLQENKGLKETVEEYNQLKESLEEIEVLIEIGLEESDDSIEFLKDNLGDYLDHNYLDFTKVAAKFFEINEVVDNIKFIERL